MDQREIARRRLVAQGLVPAAPNAPAEIVRRLGAVQAQDYLGALWAVGARVVDATQALVARALAEGRIVRTWPMRGTIHFVAPADVRWMLGLLTPRVVQRSQGRLRQLGIDAATLVASERVFVAALEGGRHLTRPELFGALRAAGIAPDGQRGIHIIGQLAQAGVLCFGAHAGKQATFTLLEEWVAPAPVLARDEALAALAMRYFTSRGPATVYDFCWWSGLTVAEAKTAIALVAGELAAAQFEGQTYYYAEGDAPAEGDEPLLLPPFDEVLIAYRDRSASLDAAHSGLVAPGSNGIFNPIIVVDGRVVGTWRRSLKKGRVDLSFSPFEQWPAGMPQALGPVSERYGHFLGLTPVLAGEA
jgi:hypothetical protein